MTALPSSTLSLVLVGALLLGAAPLSTGCASGGAGAASSSAKAPAGPTDLQGTRWKLPFTDGGIDGTLIEFALSSDGRYLGKLVEAGNQMRKRNGAYVGLVMIELWPSKESNSYAGLYRKPGREPIDGTFSVSADGQELKMSMDDGHWVRAE